MNQEMRKDESAEQIEKREKDWGKQFDIWLIRAAKKERTLTFEYQSFGSNKMGTFIKDGIPLRVDKYFIQIRWTSGEEEWLNKSFLVKCRDAQNEVNV